MVNAVSGRLGFGATPAAQAARRAGVTVHKERIGDQLAHELGDKKKLEALQRALNLQFFSESSRRAREEARGLNIFGV